MLLNDIYLMKDMGSEMLFNNNHLATMSFKMKNT